MTRHSKYKVVVEEFFENCHDTYHEYNYNNAYEGLECFMHEVRGIKFKDYKSNFTVAHVRFDIDILGNKKSLINFVRDDEGNEWAS